MSSADYVIFGRYDESKYDMFFIIY